MKQVLTLIAQALVDNPDQVNVRETVGAETTIYEISVAPSDLGKIIGKHGRTAAAIRLILGAASMKAKQRFRFEVLE